MNCAATGPSQSRVAGLKAEIARARLEYESFETHLYVARPELSVHRGEASIITAEELTALLPDAASALLEYVVTDDVTYLFAVTKMGGQPAGVRVFTLPINKQSWRSRPKTSGSSWPDATSASASRRAGSTTCC